MTDRSRARELMEAALAEGRPLAWFEPLYAAAAAGEASVPWADLVPNPMLVAWLDRESVGAGRALDVGCGYGDNAAELARRGLEVVGFDLSPSAVARARERFGDVAELVPGDVLAPPDAWRGAFDLVHETYTLQVLPPALRARALAQLAELVAPGGRLLVICRGRDAGDPPGRMPWPLTRAELEAIALPLESFEDFFDDEDPPVRRFRAVFRRG